MQLKFKKTKNLEEYRSIGILCRDGEIISLDVSKAQRLLLDFPNNFEIVPELGKKSRKYLKNLRFLVSAI